MGQKKHAECRKNTLTIQAVHGMPFAVKVHIMSLSNLTTADHQRLTATCSLLVHAKFKIALIIGAHNSNQLIFIY